MSDPVLRDFWGSTDLERQAVSAYLQGKNDDAVDAMSRAHTESLARGDLQRAARTAIWLGFALRGIGELARSGGWFERARRTVDDAHLEGAERGYLLLPVALGQVGGGNLAAAEATFAEAARIGERFGERDLMSLARQGRGRTLIGLGRIAEGVALLDEAMVAVTSGEVSPVIAGIVYCSVISACFDLFDIRRAREWTEALNHWCASQPGLVAYRGECLVHRAEIMRLHGTWHDAVGEARRACECLAGQPALGAAFYELGEVHRIRGEFDKAEEAYRMAGESGRSPHPGLALLRLMQGRTDLAKAAISRVVAEARDMRTRSRVLGAYVEILLAANELPAARAAVEELGSIAERLNTPFIRAVAAHAAGALRLAEGDPSGALASLRTACTIWQELAAPYEAARTRTLIGLVCRALGDVDGADIEINGACREFQKLGAAPDVARVQALAKPAAPAGPLTEREIEVLKLIATGKTNRSIAEALRISEKTVARHVSNIFTKLDLPSRAAATAYAFQHRLV